VTEERALTLGRGGLDGIFQQTQTFITALVTGLIVLGAEVR